MRIEEKEELETMVGQLPNALQNIEFEWIKDELPDADNCEQQQQQQSWQQLHQMVNRFFLGREEEHCNQQQQQQKSGRQNQCVFCAVLCQCLIL